MQPSILLNLSAAVLAAGILNAQIPGDPIIEPVVPPAVVSPALPEETLVPSERPNTSEGVSQQETGPAERQSVPTVETPVEPLKAVPQQEKKQDFEMTDAGATITGMPLNALFSYLAQEANLQYFYNQKITGPEFVMDGHLINDSPLAQMDQIALLNGLTLFRKGNTIAALTKAQLADLPSEEFHYQLQYLRPKDMETIGKLVQPILSGSGKFTFEPKTNTIVVFDSSHRIAQVKKILQGIDKTKPQIVIGVKILRINSTAAERTGVNWSGPLGTRGTDLNLSRDLNSVFGLPSKLADSSGDGMNLVLSPSELTGVLRALAEGGLARQEQNPTLITEDNEQANISLIDRIPIVTTTTTATTAGVQPTVSEDVRYKIDPSDQTIDANPEKHREIGISISVMPTLLPNGTIRMSMRPRSAQVAEYFISPRTGNKYPRVTEAMLETIATVPDGHSLVVGGFYGETQGNAKTKVPILGDLPGLNFFFKSKELTQEKNSLVFVVTPGSYDSNKRSQAARVNSNMRNGAAMAPNHDWIDQNNPGPSHEPNLKRSIRGLQPSEAPFYPSQDDLGTDDKPDRVQIPSSTRSRFGKGGKR
jgi:Flp pilus assembly secretin CpaC